MKALIVSTTLLTTIMLALLLGIGCGYVCIIGVLKAMGHRSNEKPSEEHTGLTAVPARSGD